MSDSDDRLGGGNGHVKARGLRPYLDRLLKSKSPSLTEQQWPDYLPEGPAPGPAAPVKGEDASTTLPALQSPIGYEGPDWSRGMEDGRVGQPPDEGEKVLAAQARLELRAELEESERRVSRLKAAVESHEAVVKRLVPRLEEVERAFATVWEKKQRNLHDFSRYLAWLYLFFGAVLLLSDIPLSLKLVAVGFGVRTKPEPGQEGLSVDDLFRDPWGVFQLYWEAIFLALGVAFVGIFVKYFVDLIVLREEEAKKPSLFVKVVMGLILAGFITTIWVLGVYRAEIQQQTSYAEIVNAVNAENQEKVSQNLPALTEGEVNAEIERRYRKARESAPTWTSFTFVALTLLLPVIGGVCFSASGTRFRNAKQFRTLSSERRELERALDARLAELKRVEEELLVEKAILDQARLSPKAGDVAELRQNLYRHGYERGRHVPAAAGQGLRLYDWCRGTVARLLAKKTREKLRGA